MSEIKRAAVIGAGVMGSGIAAHLANAGIQVLLLDVPQSGFGKKNALAENAIERMLKSDPPSFMTKKNAELIKVGNTESDFDKLAEVDWIIEAIVEKLEVKQELYARIEKIKKPSAIVSSNTSTIPLKRLLEGRSDAFKEAFLITHFFNPPRFMRLLEVVRSPNTREEIYETLVNFADFHLGKGVVVCNDTPGFIANRIGVYWLQIGLVQAIELGMSVEEADALFGKPMGIPKMGIFGLLDLVGLDLIPLIGRNMKANLPATDPYVEIYQEPPVLTKMIEEGYTGRKGKGGFYRLNEVNGKKIKESINFKTNEYSVSKKASLVSLSNGKLDLKAILTSSDKGGEYAWKVLSGVLSYAASLVPEISNEIFGIDEAMRLGYNWKMGPFELIDKIGASWFAEKLSSENRPVPEILKKVGTGTFYRVENGKLQYFSVSGSYKDIVRKPGVLLLTDIKLASKPIAKNGSASLWDIGDGIACLEFNTKMNAIDPEIFKMIKKSIDIVSKDYKGLVIYNEASNFSAGANIGLALFVADVGLWPLIADIVKEGQDTYQALKKSPFPVVGAPSGMALGGGCEILLHCDAIQAHSETYMGLVEVGVGLVPAWGGCKELLSRWINNSKRPGGSMVAVGKVFELIGTAHVNKSAFEAKDNLYLRQNDQITMNRDRVLFDAKQKALELAKNYKTPEEEAFALPGSVARVAMSMAVKGFVKIGKASPYDEVVAKKLAEVLSGGDTDITDAQSAGHILQLEREAFMELVQNPKTLARMEHILETGKPLRN